MYILLNAILVEIGQAGLVYLKDKGRKKAARLVKRQYAHKNLSNPVAYSQANRAPGESLLGQQPTGRIHRHGSTIGGLR